MPIVRVLNTSRSVSHPIQARLCNTFFSRFKGLMFAPSIAPEGGVLIDEQADSRINTSIHMFFMNFDIAAVWIHSSGRVVDTTLARRWRPYYAPQAPARYILEVHPDRLQDFTPGDQVTFQHE